MSKTGHITQILRGHSKGIFKEQIHNLERQKS